MVKGEIGVGSAVAQQKCAEHRDKMTPDGFLSNHAGGISTGQDITAHIVLKATSSLTIPGRTVKLRS